MSVTAGVSDTCTAIRDKLRGKIGQTKVKRYWPGKAPAWADNGEEDNVNDIHVARLVGLETTFPSRENDNVIDIHVARLVGLESAFPSRENDNVDVHDIVLRDNDRRLRRLADNRLDVKEEVRADGRRVRRHAEVVSEEEEKMKQERVDLEEDDEDAVDERRRRIMEKLRKREKEEAALVPEDEDEDEEEDEEEYETDLEKEQISMVMVKVVFVPKAKRDTVAERERIEEEGRVFEETLRKRAAERKVETKQIVVEEIRKDMEILKNLEAEADVADVETDDELNEAEEYEAWKAREIARIKRDRDDRDAMVKKREDVERVRNMNEEERIEWDRKNLKPAAC